MDKSNLKQDEVNRILKSVEELENDDIIFILLKTMHNRSAKFISLIFKLINSLTLISVEYNRQSSFLCT